MTKVLDKEHGGVPDRLEITYNCARNPDQWTTVEEPLFDDENARWFQHPRFDEEQRPYFGRRVDVVALPISKLPKDVVIESHDPFASRKMRIAIPDQVSIIGFPFGVTAGGSYGVWTQGTVASEPEVDFEDMPVFLVDSRTRKGLSGAPVIAYSNGGVRVNDDTSATIGGPPVEYFLGVYAGRINEQSDLGRVWKADVVKKLLVQGEPGETGD